MALEIEISSGQMSINFGVGHGSCDTVTLAHLSLTEEQATEIGGLARCGKPLTITIDENGE
jgi:hypothetical protein